MRIEDLQYFIGIHVLSRTSLSELYISYYLPVYNELFDHQSDYNQLIWYMYPIALAHLNQLAWRSHSNDLLINQSNCKWWNSESKIWANISIQGGHFIKKSTYFQEHVSLCYISILFEFLLLQTFKNSTEKAWNETGILLLLLLPTVFKKHKFQFFEKDYDLLFKNN